MVTRGTYPTYWPDVNELIDRLGSDVRYVLREQFIGMYLRKFRGEYNVGINS